MKILYENKDLKKSVSDSKRQEQIEDIISYLESSLGKKVMINSLEWINDKKVILKGRSITNNHEFILSVDNVYYPRAFGCPYAVSLYVDEKRIKHYNVLSKNAGFKVSDEYHYGDTVIKKEPKFGTLNKNMTPYTIQKNRKSIHLVTTVDSDLFFKMLVDLQGADIASIYKEFQEKDPKYVYDFNVEITDNNTNEKESLIINDGIFKEYKKVYMKGLIEVTLMYKDNEITVTTTQRIEEGKDFITEPISVKEEIEKVKKMFK